MNPTDPPSSEAARPLRLAMLGLAALLVGHAVYLGVVAEDAYISFRFARHLADGQGLVWNAGEPPVEGYTNFLWVVLAAASILARLDPVRLMPVLGVLASLACLMLTERFARRRLGLSPAAALIPAALLAVSGPFATWAGSGMETSLFTLLILVGTDRFHAWSESGGAAPVLAAAGSLAVATLTRPEGALAFVVLAVGAVVLRGRRPDRRSALLAVTAYALPIAVYFWWRWSYFGFLLPNTFYAKTGGSWVQHLRGAQYLGLFALHFGLPLLVLLLPALFGGFSRRRGRGAAALCAAWALAYLASVGYVGGDYMAMYRFVVPALPAVYLLAGWLAFPSGPVPAGRRRSALAGAIVAALALTALQSTPLEALIFPRTTILHGTYRGVQIERWHVRRYRAIAEHLVQQARPGDSLALRPVGVIPYVTGMTVRSIYAIVDPYIAHKPVDPASLGRGLPGHEKEDVPYALSRRPTYVLFSHDLTPAPGTSVDLGPRAADTPAGFEEFLAATYRLRSDWVEDERNSEAGYLTFLERQDGP